MRFTDKSLLSQCLVLNASLHQNGKRSTLSQPLRRATSPKVADYFRSVQDLFNLERLLFSPALLAPLAQRYCVRRLENRILSIKTGERPGNTLSVQAPVSRERSEYLARGDSFFFTPFFETTVLTL
jgi:hypothetical protein